MLNRILFPGAILGNGTVGFLLACRFVGTQVATGVLVSAATVAVLISALAGYYHRHQVQKPVPGEGILAALVTVVVALALATAYQTLGYLRLPVDLLSFSESPFVNEIVKLRLNLPIFTAPEENNSYPYTPGAPMLTYMIAALFDQPDSIPVFRFVQFSYIVIAAGVATSICEGVARLGLQDHEYRARGMWRLLWFGALFLVATDPAFNLYTHSLHNDGLALLLTIVAFRLMVSHALNPRARLLVPMAMLPAVGFLVKQNMIMWLGLFWFYQLLSGTVSWRQQAFFLGGGVVLILAVVGASYIMWGENFLYWVFVALGAKEVSLLRVFQHAFEAGLYVIMGLIGAWVLLLRQGAPRALKALWVCWLIMFSIQLYTSGIGWQTNHLGPGIMIAASWFLVALIRVWSASSPGMSRLHGMAVHGILSISIVCLLGALGLVREPMNTVPEDMSRHIADVEREFEGLDAREVLLDNGTWVYLREGVLMRDRSSPVALHVGKNQPDINHSVLKGTIERIESKQYRKILAHQLEPGHSWHTWYDFQDRGSGVKDAILDNYRVARKIPGVQGVRDERWLKPLVGEVWVFVPKEG